MMTITERTMISMTTEIKVIMRMTMSWSMWMCKRMKVRLGPSRWVSPKDKLQHEDDNGGTTSRATSMWMRMNMSINTRIRISMTINMNKRIRTRMIMSLNKRMMRTSMKMAVQMGISVRVRISMTERMRRSMMVSMRMLIRISMSMSTRVSIRMKMSLKSRAIMGRTIIMGMNMIKNVVTRVSMTDYEHG